MGSQKEGEEGIKILGLIDTLDHGWKACIFFFCFTQTLVQQLSDSGFHQLSKLLLHYIKGMNQADIVHAPFVNSRVSLSTTELFSQLIHMGNGMNRCFRMRHWPWTSPSTLHLQELGNFIMAEKVVAFLTRPDVKAQHMITKDITLWTAQRYLHSLGYRITQPKKGQYGDGHEREDVVLYWNIKFLPQWAEFQGRMHRWS